MDYLQQRVSFVYNGNGEEAVDITPEDMTDLEFSTTRPNNTSIIIKTIPDRCYYNCKRLQRVDLRNSVLETIGEEAFASCLVLEHILFPSTLKRIGKGAFRKCFELKDIVFNNNCDDDGGGGGGLEVIGEEAFFGCSKIETFPSPSSLIYLGNCAFRGCSKLQQLSLSEKLETIGSHTFFWCSSLTSVILPSTVSRVGERAFGGCDNLGEIKFNEGLCRIEKEAFLGCISLDKVVLPSTIVDLGESAFKNCSKLKHIVLNEGVTTIGYRMFCSCSALEDIVLPLSVTIIEEDAFSQCSRLKHIIFNEGLKTLGEGAFDGCESLTSIITPSTVTDIGKSAFHCCTKLEKCVLSGGIEKIGSRLFYKCSSLKYVELSFSLFQTIEPDIFEGCSSIEWIKISCLSKRLGLMSSAGQMDVIDKTREITTVTLNKRDILIPGSIAQNGAIAARHARSQAWIRLFGRGLAYRTGLMHIEDEIKTCKNWVSTYTEDLKKVSDLIAVNEARDAITIVELALWKTKMEENGAVSANRDACRRGLPGPAKDAIVQYLL